MYCNQCGSQNAPDARFCLKCGAPLLTGMMSAHTPYTSGDYGYSPYDTGYARPGDPAKDWAAITSLVTGITSALSCFCGSFFIPILFAVLLAPAAVVFGIIGLKSRQRGMAIAGLILGIVMVLLTIFLILVLIGMSRSHMQADIPYAFLSLRIV